MYVFSIKDDGFVILSADNRVKPILAYSTNGTFDTGNLSGGFRLQLESYQEEIEHVWEHDIAASPDILAEWVFVAEKATPTPNEAPVA